MKISGKTALITGGARMGVTVARALADSGAAVALAYRGSREAAEEVARAITDAGGRATALRADLARQDDIRELIDGTVREFGRLDILVNMASRYAQRDFATLTEADWEEAMSVDARGTYLACLAAAPHLRAGGGGRIINFSDWTPASGRPRYRGYVPYYTAKASVKALTESLALELAPEVLVNCIAPGPILPPPELPEDEIEAVAKATPLGRWGGAEEIAKAVMFLVETDFITGECIRVDGGRHLS